MMSGVFTDPSILSTAAGSAMLKTNSAKQKSSIIANWGEAYSRSRPIRAGNGAVLSSMLLGTFTGRSGVVPEGRDFFFLLSLLSESESDGKSR